MNWWNKLDRTARILLVALLVALIPAGMKVADCINESNFAAEQARSNARKEEQKIDATRLTISGESKVKDGYSYNITCTVTNNGKMTHMVAVKAIFLDKYHAPIDTRLSDKFVVKPGDIQGFSIYYSGNVEVIDAVILEIVPSIAFAY